jgi:hypothetical protein
MMVNLQKLRLTLLVPLLMFIALTAGSQQGNYITVSAKPSKQLRNFTKLANQANAVFTYPQGFKEISAVNNEGLPVDYALELPGSDFQIWFEVRSQKRILEDYQHSDSDTTRVAESPDSLYNKIGLTLASSLTDGQTYFTTVIPPDYLARYNATEGKTYLLNLADAPVTRHYKYALLITLHKDHAGTIVAVCLANDKGAEFFKNINKASRCLKFKP